MFPRLIVNIDKIRDNIERLVSILGKKGLEMVGVTKLFMGEPKIARAFRESGVSVLADARFDNVKRMVKSRIAPPFMMIRIPPPSRISEMLEYVDHFLVSEPSIVEMIDKQASNPVKLYYMVDVGDLREGVMFDKAIDEIKPLLGKRKARIVGVGTNVGCFGGVLPSEENLKMLVDIAKELRLEEISVGGTVCLMALERGILPREVTQMRIGEAALLGTDVTGNRSIDYLRQGTVTLEAEIVEVKWKPSVPIGERGRDAMGRVPEFEDLGTRLRAIVALGEQDVNPRGLEPLDEGAFVVHASSDHLIVDVTDVNRKITVGDILRFKPNYSATLRAMTSPYVRKIFLE